MRTASLWLLALTLLAPAARAQDDAKDKKPDMGKQEFQALQKEFQTTQQSFFKKDPKTDEERLKLLQEYKKALDPFAAKFAALAQKYAKDPVAFDAWGQVLQNWQFSPEADKAVEAILKDHSASDKLQELLPRLTGMPTPAVEKLVRGLADKAKEGDARGLAVFELAQFLNSKVETAQTLKGIDEEMLKQIELMYGPNAIKWMSATDILKTQEEAEKLYDQVVTKYANVKPKNGGALGEQAKATLFELRNLGIGKKAPEIEGEDVDGKKFKLSDYRGKVVVLDFWGNW